MAPRARRWRWAGLILAMVVAGGGCNPGTMLYFLWPGSDPGLEPKCKLTSTDKDKEVKVVVLAYCGLETRPEFLRVDRELSTQLVQKLQKHFKEKKEKVTFIPISKVEKFKEDHPNWQALGPQDIGSHFDADFVIDIEIETMSLYEPGSRNTLYRGNAELSVKATDLHNADEGPIFNETYTCEYPKARGPIPVDGSSSVQQFRMAFLNHVTDELSRYFIPHPFEDEHFQMD